MAGVSWVALPEEQTPGCCCTLEAPLGEASVKQQQHKLLPAEQHYNLHRPTKPMYSRSEATYSMGAKKEIPVHNPIHTEKYRQILIQTYM